MSILRRVVAFSSALAVIANAAELGDKSDKAGVVQTVLAPRELIPPAPALAPREARVPRDSVRAADTAAPKRGGKTSC